MAVAIIAARNERGRVGAAVAATRDLVDRVYVVDDRSPDGTGEEARRAGATVLVPPRHLGKGEALEGALDRVARSELYLLLDADLGATAGEAWALLREVASGRADLAIASLPPQPGHGGFRLVKRLAARVIRDLSGFRAEEPMSGQRAITAEALAAVRPLAPGFGVEVAMTVDAVRAGFRVVEVPLNMTHAPTGRDVQGFLHRARQGLDLLRAAVLRLRR